MSETPASSAENDATHGDDAGKCPKCGSQETHVSYEDIEANYCRSCRSYWRPIPPEPRMVHVGCHIDGECTDRCHIPPAGGRTD